jgi:hypothetical protein
MNIQMNFGKALAFLALLATVWGVTYMHDRAHRYDIVVAGAGSGGSQDSVGATEVTAYLVDHKTGKVWEFIGIRGVPTIRKSCHDLSLTETESGCQESVKK